MKRDLYKVVVDPGFPYSHYGFNISFDIDDDHKDAKNAIDYFDFMIRFAMGDFKKHCRSKKIRLSNLKVE